MRSFSGGWILGGIVGRDAGAVGLIALVRPRLDLSLLYRSTLNAPNGEGDQKDPGEVHDAEICAFSNLEIRSFLRIGARIRGSNLPSEFYLGDPFVSMTTARQYRDFAQVELEDVEDMVPRKRKKCLECFPQKLYRMLDFCHAENLEHVVSWYPHGRAFAIIDPDKFLTTVMPLCVCIDCNFHASHACIVTDFFTRAN